MTIGIKVSTTLIAIACATTKNGLRKKLVKDYNPRIVCADGFSISVQARESSYCTPRCDDPGTTYTHVECGFPSSAPVTEELKMYAEALHGCENESDCDFTNTVYGYVPVKTVQAEFQEHGGIVQGEMP